MYRQISYSLLWIVILWMGSITSAVETFIPGSTAANPDVPGESTIEGFKWEYSYIDVIAFVNRYLRYAIWLVCFLFMIWNGYKLIMARGDQAQMKKATKALIGSAVGIAVCLLAYVIVKFAVNLF